MTQVKFCKDCRWYKNYPKALTQHICNRRTKKVLSIITGKIETGCLEESCRTERHEFILDEPCGPEAKYFEKRLSWWERLKEKMK